MTDQEFLENHLRWYSEDGNRIILDADDYYRLHNIAKRTLRYDGVAIWLIEELGRYSDPALQDYRAKLRGIVRR